MVEKILDFYRTKQCSYVVITSDVAFILNDVSEEKKKGLEINVIDDARSATFFAYGEARSFKTPVLLFVGGQYLSHCYTGLTEAWFQQIPLITIALEENEDSIYYDYLKPCICKGLTIQARDWKKYKDDLEVSVCAYGPTLINMVYKFPSPKEVIYENVLQALNEKIGKDDTVIYYGDLNSDFTYDYKMIPIDESSKYGIISRYMGYLLGCRDKCYLVAPLEAFKYDTNIFNNRYVNGLFKVIFVNQGENVVKPKEWIENNLIECRVLDTLEEKEFTEFITAKKPIVLILNIAGGFK
jgi:hypothetical protein